MIAKACWLIMKSFSWAIRTLDNPDGVLLASRTVRQVLCRIDTRV
jgi:hypothetical protein